MNERDTLFLFTVTDVSAPMGMDSLNSYTREFIRSGQYFLDYPKLYAQLGNAGIERYILDFIEKNKIKVLIFMWADSWGFDFRVEFFEMLRKKVFLVMMPCDWEHYFSIKDIYYAQAADLVIVSNIVGRHIFRHYGINAITFHSSDASVYRKLNGIYQDIDVSFVGSLVKYGRKELLNYIVANGINLQMYGSGTPNGRVSMEKLVEIYNRSKINLNFTGIDLPSILTRGQKISTRIKQFKGTIIDIALCGGFILTENSVGNEEIFEPDKEFAIFNTKEKLLQKIRYYLNNEAERNLVAENGFQRALKNYAVSTALPIFLQKLREMNKEKIYTPSKIILDEVFLRNYATYRFPLILKFISSGKYSFALEELVIIFKIRKMDFYIVWYYLKRNFLDKFPRLAKLLKRFF